MTRASLITAGILLLGLAFAQCVAAEDPLAFVLELAVADTLDPVEAPVKILSEGGRGHLTLTLPGDESVTVPYLVVGEETIKFQVPRLSDEHIATIQFVGKGAFDSGFSGRFWGFVDGSSRPDMSGKFRLRTP